jgi:DNA (cytosine-5)-methyltransferase 1
MRFFDAFAGIGGFALPLIHARHTCVGFSEIDPDAERVYLSHFPSHRNHGDISALDPRRLPDFDLLCGGFPCQPFSVAGKSRGFADPRGQLFFHLCRLAEAKRPRLLFFENVKGLLLQDDGRSFHRVLSTLDGLGYDVQWQLLNSSSWLPQNRERVFIVAHLRGSPRPEVFPLRRDVLFTLPAGYRALAFRDDACQSGYIWNRVNCLLASFRGLPTSRSKPVLVLPDGRVRQITPLECERLQGFPDEWTALLPDGHRYRCIGNVVTTHVVWAITQRLR